MQLGLSSSNSSSSILLFSSSLSCLYLSICEFISICRKKSKEKNGQKEGFLADGEDKGNCTGVAQIGKRQSFQDKQRETEAEQCWLSWLTAFQRQVGLVSLCFPALIYSHQNREEEVNQQRGTIEDTSTYSFWFRKENKDVRRRWAILWKEWWLLSLLYSCLCMYSFESCLVTRGWWETFGASEGVSFVLSETGAVVGAFQHCWEKTGACLCGTCYFWLLCWLHRWVCEWVWVSVTWVTDTFWLNAKLKKLTCSLEFNGLGV